MIKATEIIEAKKQLDALGRRNQCEKLVLAQIGSLGFEMSGGGVNLMDGTFDLDFINDKTDEFIWIEELEDDELEIHYSVEKDDKKTNESEANLSMKTLSKLPGLIKKWRESKN
jgi:hypothetical protein